MGFASTLHLTQLRKAHGRSTLTAFSDSLFVKSLRVYRLDLRGICWSRIHCARTALKANLVTQSSSRCPLTLRSRWVLFSQIIYIHAMTARGEWVLMTGTTCSTARVHAYHPHIIITLHSTHFPLRILRSHIHLLNVSLRLSDSYLRPGRTVVQKLTCNSRPSAEYRLPRSKNPLTEIGTGVLASGLAGFGIVALFCTTGVYV